MATRSSRRARRREQLRFRRRGFARFFFFSRYGAAKSGTGLGTAAAPNQATKQQETTQQYQQRFVHFLVENKERRRSALLPPRFRVASLLLSAQIVGGSKPPLPQRLPAPSSFENPFSLSLSTPDPFFLRLPIDKSVGKSPNSAPGSCPPAEQPSPLPAPHTLPSAAEICSASLVPPSTELVSRLYRGRKKEKKKKEGKNKAKKTRNPLS